MGSVIAKSHPRFAPDKAKPSFFWVLACLVLPLWALMVRYRFHGEPLPKTGALVLAPNHYSEIDPIVMGVALWKLGRAPRFMAKASLFNVPVLKWLLNASGQIAVERHGGSQSALRAGRELTRSGGALIVYPEGSLTRDPDLWPMRGKSGAVRLALEGNIPLYPAAHWGTQALMPRYGKRIHFFPRKTIDVTVGKPLDLSKYRGSSDPAALSAATNDLMNAIAALLGELRGELPPVERWDPSKQGQSQTGRFEGEAHA